jgi:protein involved in sex pheromone biosynthesis
MKKIVLFSLGITLVLSACGKFRYDKDQSAEVNRKVESAFDEMTNISDQAITGNMVYYKNGGVIVTHPGDKPVQELSLIHI